jgi:hypothetical protein
MKRSLFPNLIHLILYNGRITTLDTKYPEATNLAINDGRVIGVDDVEEYAHSTHQLLAGIEATQNRYDDFFGLGCDCFAF